MPLPKPAAARLLPCAMAALLALPAPAAAQWVAVGRWGSEGNFRYVAPGTWMVLPTETGAEVSADGDNHVTRLTLVCEPGAAAARVELTRYFGYALPRDPATQAKFLLVLGDVRMELDATWSDAIEGWVAEDAMGPDTLSLFSWANQITVLDADEAALATYRMNGSSAAREALRRRCGI